MNQFMFSLPFVLALLFSRSAFASSYLCSDFARDFAAVAAGEITQSSPSPPAFSRAVGAIVAGYYVATGRPYDEKDTSNLAEFEQAVLTECAKAPTSSAFPIIVGALQKLPGRRPLIASGGYSPRNDVVLGSPRLTEYSVIYEIENQTDKLISVGVRCSFYDSASDPVGRSGGRSNAIPPHARVVGESLLTVDNVDTVECRITDVRVQDR